MASEHEPHEHETRKVEVSLVEAIDHHEPLVEEIRRVVRVLAVANKALKASGIELVTKKPDVIGEAPEHPDLPTVDSLSLEEVAELLTAVRIAEVDGALDRIMTDSYDPALSNARTIAKAIWYLDERREEIYRISGREPE